MTNRVKCIFKKIVADLEAVSLLKNSLWICGLEFPQPFCYQGRESQLEYNSTRKKLTSIYYFLGHWY